MSPKPQKTKVETLMKCFDHLDDEHIHHNKVIHQTFYLSVVFFAAIVSVAARVDGQTGLVVGAGVLVLVFLWISTHTYIRSRRQVKQKKRTVIEELDELDVDFEHFDSFHEVTYNTVRGDPIDGAEADSVTERHDPAFPFSRKSVFQQSYYPATVLVVVGIGVL
jgi:uncharacterized membrane protein (DUF485 family)